MRIEVTQKADWKAKNNRRMTTFAPGQYTVTREIGDELVSRGVAKEIDPPTAAEAKAAKKNAG